MWQQCYGRGGYARYKILIRHVTLGAVSAQIFRQNNEIRMQHNNIPQHFLSRKMMSEAKLAEAYLRETTDADGNVRLESFEEAVDRVMGMHKEKYADKLSEELLALMAEASDAYKEKLVLGAQRALQFGGPQILAHEGKMYNCSASYADRIAFFQEAMYLLLCGCGVGFSVQKQHVAKLPEFSTRTLGVKVFQVPDSIEGWSDAFGVLMSSYTDASCATFPEYSGYVVHFDYSLVRPKGAFISGGFKAPGPEPLRQAVQRCEALLDKTLRKSTAQSVRLAPIVVYDLVMHMSDAVISGGVRRSATICLFSKGDREMLAAKTGDWWVTEPQRARSNNSVVLKRDTLTYQEWCEVYENVRQFGEPGFVFVDDEDTLYNPCVEVGMRAIEDATGQTGFQMCNLTEINGAKCVDKDTFVRACRASAILGTLQAGYTNFKYLTKATKSIVEREALLGCSITAWMNSPDILFDEAILREGAEEVKRVNREVAALIGINPAARTTNVKPSGNASTILGTASGIHGEHAPRYFRNVQMSKDSEVARLIAKTNPKMIEKSVWSATGDDVVISFPVEATSTSIFRESLYGVHQLEYVRKAQQFWVEPGTNVELCTSPTLRHNVSNTISVTDWDEVREYIFENRQWFAGISLLPAVGDKVYPQAPFTEVKAPQDIFAEYGDGALYASGLIVDGMHAFNGNLWSACDFAVAYQVNAEETTAENVMKHDWARRFKKFAANFVGGDLTKTTYLLKDCFNSHKWAGIRREFQYVDFTKELGKREYVDVDTLGAQGCAGGTCEVTF